MFTKKRLVKIWIRNDLPLPKKVCCFPAMKHPLHDMLKQLEVGESFAWPMELKANPNSLQSVTRVHEKATGKKFKFRTVYIKLKKTYCIWRIK
jgi:hypothetical protein